jgi:UDP-2,3-diacylglucosamine hydrolase
LKPKKVYFASDFHLGIPDHDSSLIREKMLVRWLETIRADAEAIYLMGDIFDFWFEYKQVVPKGYVRLLGKLAEMTDSGIPIHIFRGNHDVWAFGYLHKEAGIQIHRHAEVIEYHGKKLFLAHGDGLGPGDYGYKFLKKVFAFKPNQFLFKWLHPDLGTAMGLFFSHRSRLANIAKEKTVNKDRPLEKEMLYQYALRKTEQLPEIDYFIFGHRHIPILTKLNEKASLIVLGDWITHFTYGVLDEGKMELKKFEAKKK